MRDLSQDALASRFDRPFEKPIAGLLRGLGGHLEVNAVGPVEHDVAVFGRHLGRLIEELVFFSHFRKARKPGFGCLLNDPVRAPDTRGMPAIGREQTRDTTHDLGR